MFTLGFIFVQRREEFLSQLDVDANNLRQSAVADFKGCHPDG